MIDHQRKRVEFSSSSSFFKSIFIIIHISLSQIRKRKLEKADILELTVNHLRNLQKIQSCRYLQIWMLPFTGSWKLHFVLISPVFAGNIAASKLSDYQSGFRRCVANVDQYALMTDGLSGSDRWIISQLASKLWSSRRAEEAVSTTDSGPSRPKARDKDLRIQPKVNEDTNVSELPAGDVTARPRSATEVRTDAASKDKSPTNKKTDSAADMNQNANLTHMWRPW